MKPRKSDKYKAKISPLRLKGKKEKLLARWTDGLFYFVRVTKISEANKTCTVEFEDKSQTIVHFKDLLEEKEDGLVECHCCGKSDSTTTNVLVECSNCEREYHQHCHIPPLTAEQCADDKFTCRICVFASCAQPGGAKKSGPLAEKYGLMKRHFPYDIKHLTWNATHTCNVEQYFCYCGGPGIWYSKMLQCCRCRQWFHEACLQCLNEELLLGDRFFVFACAHCNHGEEFIQRMDLSWLDIAYISLFHLIMTVGKRYIDVDTDIVPFVMGKAQTFGLKKLLNGLHGNADALRNELLKVFRKHSTLFCCGAEVKKRCTYYGIRERIPPCPPSVLIPAGDEKITASSLGSSSGKKSTFNPSKFIVQVPYVLRGANKIVSATSGAKLRESKLAKIARVKSEHNYCTPLKGPDSSPSRLRSQVCPMGDGVGLGAGAFEQLYDANNNSPSKLVPVKKEPGTSDDSDAVVSSDSPVTTEKEHKEKTFWSLDTAFPEPPNFVGYNHPFLTEFEQDNLRKQRHHFDNQLECLSALLMDEAEKEQQKISCPPIGTPTATAKEVKGFKGELADLITSTCSSNASTPKKGKGSPHKNNLTPDKLLDLVSPPPNGVLSRRNRSPSRNRRESNNSRGSSLSPRCVNGVIISPSVNKIPPKNGLTQIKVEPSISHNSQPEDMLDVADQKRLKALNRCLKNLTPTCGFRFPVLEENHPAVAQVDSVSKEAPESSKLGHGPSSSPSAALQSSPVNRPHPKSLSKCGKRGRKRKLSCAEQQAPAADKSCQSDSVRRSHRSRSCVKRFEASIGCKTYEFLDSINPPTTHLNEAEQYEVVSLRTGLDGDLVEYLITWST